MAIKNTSEKLRDRAARNPASDERSLAQRVFDLNQTIEHLEGTVGKATREELRELIREWAADAKAEMIADGTIKSR